MAAGLTANEVCGMLGVDAWGLRRLIEMGEIHERADGGFDPTAATQLAEARDQRRADALADIAALDAPHLGLVP